MMRTWREHIPEHFVWKLISVVVALLIWSAINFNIQDSFRSSQNRAATASLTNWLPVTVITAAADLRVFTLSPKEVQVTVRGDADALGKLKKTDVQVFVDLMDVKDSRRFHKPVIVHTPPNVTAVRVVPDEVTVERVPPAESPSNSRNQN